MKGEPHHWRQGLSFQKRQDSEGLTKLWDGAYLILVFHSSLRRLECLIIYILNSQEAARQKTIFAKHFE